MPPFAASVRHRNGLEAAQGSEGVVAPEMLLTSAEQVSAEADSPAGSRPAGDSRGVAALMEQPVTGDLAVGGL